MSSLKKRGRVWYIKYQRTLNGQTDEVTRSLNTGSKEVAYQLKKELDRLVVQGERNPFLPGFEVRTRKEKTWWSVPECVDDYLNDRQHCRQITLRNDRYAFNHWIREMKLEELPISQIRRNVHIKPFVLRNGIKPQSMKSELRRIRTFWRWLLENERVKTDETKKIILPESTVQYFPKMLTDTEFELLIQTFRSEQKIRRKKKSYRKWMDQYWFIPVITTIYETGIRLGDAGKRNTDPKSGLMGENLIWEGPDIHFIYIGKSKTNRERLIPIPDYLNDIFKDYFEKRGIPNSDEYVFLNGKSQPINVRTIFNAFKRYCKIAGIPESRTIHGMRHARITGWIEDGYSLKEASYMAGHRTTDTTDRIYTHLAGRNLRAKMIQLSKIKDKKKKK